MLRFITLSLALHALALGAWHYQHLRPADTRADRTLALALLRPAATAARSPLDTPAQPHAPDPAAAEPPRPLPEPAPEQPPSVAPPATRHSHMPARTPRQTPASGPAATAAAATDSALPGPAEAAPASATPPDREALRAAVARAIRATFRYPRIAQRNGWEGTVTIALRVLPDGQLTDLCVSSSSGHPVLDRAAIHSLQTATVPQASQWLHDQAVDLVIPVEYRLLDS